MVCVVGSGGKPLMPTTEVKGVQHYGEYVALRGQKKSRRASDVTRVCHAGGWLKMN